MTPSHPSFSGGRLLRLCQKELRETLRDRRTIVTLLLMPLLVYPLLSMALNRFLLSAQTGAATEDVVYKIGVETAAEGASLLGWLEDPASQPPEEILATSNGKVAKFEAFQTTIDGGESPVEALKQNEIDVAAVVEAGNPPVVRLTSFNGDAASEAARRIIVERLQWLRMRTAESVVGQRIPQYEPPATVQVDSIGEQQQGSLLGTIIPLVLVLMTITGAVYPAIDLTAGERERGTMESLMASPIPRSHLLFSKYVAVVVVALLTAIANLFAMFTTLWASRLLPFLTGGEESFPWLAVLQILGLLVLFSGFFAAVLLSLTSFARSFKEAQAYLIPVMLLSLTPGMLSLMPGVTLGGPLAIAPLINIVLLAKEILQGTASAGPAVITVLSTCAYAGAAIAIASKLFGSDAVSRTSGQSFAAMLRRPTKERLVPTPQTAAMTLALLVPFYYITSNVLMRFVKDLDIFTVLLLNAGALILTFGLVPWLSVQLARCKPVTTYQLSRPSVLAMLGALLLGLGAWGFAHEAFVFADRLGLGGLEADRLENAKKTVEEMKRAPAFLLVACLALAPAVIEEFCFRGFLFTAFRKVLSPGRLVVFTALLFGLFHVVTGNVLLIERFLPTTFLGLILGWIALRTGSIWPGVLMHFTHNALLNLAIKYQDRLEFLGAGSDDKVHLPPAWLATVSALTFAGFGVLYFATRKGSAVSDDSPATVGVDVTAPATSTAE
ncbi:MAG: ABC transporter permease subunit/CPBP intramembrane protease [Planctomycetota bacterium]